jgi:hypothetical protein
MSTDDVNAAVRASAYILMTTVLDLMQGDPHQWSTRPCATCQAVSAIVGRPFGCYAYARTRVAQP